MDIKAQKVKEQYILPAALKEQYPSSVGVIPPFLRFQTPLRNQRNTRSDYENFFTDIDKFISSFDHRGEYHNLDHFTDVMNRFHVILNELSDLYPEEFDESDYTLAKMFALGHDCVHNAHKENPFYLTVQSITHLYGYSPNNYTYLQAIKRSLNVGIEEDNILTSNSRELIHNYHESIDLSEEEMSAIVVDAIAFNNGIPIEQRYILSGMIQATEFRRSINDNKPGFKFPRTQRELLAKLADIGNFTSPITSWLATSTLVNTEVAWFKGTDLLSFIDEELHFIQDIVLPALNIDSLPTIFNKEGSCIPARLPDLFMKAIDEKLEYLTDLKYKVLQGIQLDPSAKIYTNGDQASIETQDPVTIFATIVRSALAKTQRSLLDPNEPIALGQIQEIDSGFNR